MVLNVSVEIRGQSTHCHRDLGCLRKGGGQQDGKNGRENVSHCKIERYVNDDLLFVTPEKDTNCAHLLSYGYSYLCRCRVRVELFKKHKI